MPCRRFRFFLPWFSLTSSHHNCGTLKFDIAMSKLTEMINEDLISRIWGSCDDCDGWGGETKIRGEKVKPTVLIFSVQFSSPMEGPAMIVMGGGGGSVWVVGWRKSRLKKSNQRFWFFWLWFSSPNLPHQQFWEFVFDFFGRDFLHPVFPHHKRRSLKFVISCLRPTFLRI